MSKALTCNVKDMSFVLKYKDTNIEFCKPCSCKPPVLLGVITMSHPPKMQVLETLWTCVSSVLLTVQSCVA